VAGDDHPSFGAYDIQPEVRRGGMGVVYLATDRRLGRRAALKVIVPELAADAQFRRRFEREARVAATLERPHVVPVYEAGEQDGSLFIAMRFIDGRDLATEVRVDAFINAVDAVLAGARPGRRQIRQVRTAIDNGTITPAAATTGVNVVVANRQVALAAARALSVTQTDAAGPIKNLLVESFQRSLDFDRDLQDGLAAYEKGDFDRYITKVFDDAQRSNDAATKAKREFLDAYNKLRATRGRTPVGDDF
jgi:hypothetical protein